MYNINKQLKDKLLGLNNSIKTKYEKVLDIRKVDLLEFIGRYVGEVKPMEKLNKSQLHIYHQKGGIVGVDGSNNRMGGAYPHYVEIYQALAKSTNHKENPVILADVYSPLFREEEGNPLENEEEIIEDKRNIKLSTLEVEAALESIKQQKPYVIMMDGGLIRYKIYAADKWMELRQACEEEGIILIGVIEDIKTDVIGNKMKDLGIEDNFYDRELLFGKLNYGDLIIIKPEANKKQPEGYSSAFLRPSLAPSVIGMDILDSQSQHIEEMARLVFTLTPENSRGIPLWLDIVDEEVKISDEIMKALMENYMDREIYEKFFMPQRDKRN